MKESMNVTRTDQAISLPRGVTLVNESRTRMACKISSNVHDGMEWWRITSSTDGSYSEGTSPFDFDPSWRLI